MSDEAKNGTPERRKAMDKRLAVKQELDAEREEFEAMTFEQKVEYSARRAFQQIQEANKSNADRDRLTKAANARLQQLLREAGEGTEPTEEEKFANGVARKLEELETIDYQARVERAARERFAKDHGREPAADWRQAPVE